MTFKFVKKASTYAKERNEYRKENSQHCNFQFLSSAYGVSPGPTSRNSFFHSFIHSFRIQFCGWIPVTVQCTVCGESPDHERIVQSAQYMCTHSSHEQCPQHT